MAAEQDPGNWNLLIGSLGALLAGAVGWFSGHRKRSATDGADIAEEGTRRAEAVGQSTVVVLLTKRVEALEIEMRALREEYHTERRMRISAEDHIAILSRCLMAAGLDVPQQIVSIAKSHTEAKP